MKHVLRAVVLGAILGSGGPSTASQQPQTPPVPPPIQTPPPAQTPAAPAPPAPAAAVPAVPGTVTCPVPAPPAVAPSRAFNAPSGILLHQVIPTRSQDFEKVIAYVRDALAKTSNPMLREQAKGWTMWRTVEAGPNGDALYVFLMNPAVPCLDYALGQILSEAYPDPAQLSEIWKLYTSSVRPMGTTLLNLLPVPEVAAVPPLTPPTTPVAPSTPPAVPPTTAKPIPPAAKQP